MTKAEVSKTLAAHKPINQARDEIHMKMAGLGADDGKPSRPGGYLYRGRKQTVAARRAENRLKIEAMRDLTSRE